MKEHSTVEPTGFYLLGEAGGSFPPKQFASDSTYYIRLTSLMPALITQELKFILFKLS